MWRGRPRPRAALRHSRWLRRDVSSTLICFGVTWNTCVFHDYSTRAGAPAPHLLIHTGYSNSQRVDLVLKNFSHMAETILGRTANTGSFIERMSSFMDDMSKLYLGEYFARNLRRASTSAISAMPSTITASC